MISITANLAIDARELHESFIRASGPGGQNVNKLATAVELRFDVRGTPSLPEDVKERLKSLAGRRLNAEGVLVILAQRYRTQEANRRDARDRLIALIRSAAIRPKPRRPTKPTAASKLRRRNAKSQRSTLKNLRRDKPSID